jgi:hypothetical protein
MLTSHKVPGSDHANLGACNDLVYVCMISLALAAADGAVYDLRLKGEPSATNMYTVLNLAIDRGQPKAVLLYAEPSHTLIAAFLDNTDGEPAEQAWFDGLLPAHATQMHASLTAGLKGTVTRGMRPAQDDQYLAVHTLIDQDGAIIDDTFRVNTNIRDFNFVLALEPPQVQASGQMQSEQIPAQHTFTCVMGDGGSCGTAKATCSQNAATCCYKSEPAGCGWCGRAVVQCGDGPCNTCPGV